MDECTHAHAYLDVRCNTSCPYQQTNRVKVQYADVLVYRAGGKPHQRVLYAACRQEVNKYDNLAVCTIVANREGEVSSCDVPFSDNLQQFNADYLRLTKQVAESCRNHNLTDSMIIGTSALAQYEIDGAVGMYSGVFNNPFLIWGKYKRHWWKRTLTVSFQFHHTQMDGAHASRFLENLQKEIGNLEV